MFPYMWETHVHEKGTSLAINPKWREIWFFATTYVDIGARDTCTIWRIRSLSETHKAYVGCGLSAAAATDRAYICVNFPLYVGNICIYADVGQREMCIYEAYEVYARHMRCVSAVAAAAYKAGNLHWGKRDVHILGIKSLCETHETCVGCVGVEKRGLNMRGEKTYLRTRDVYEAKETYMRQKRRMWGKRDWYGVATISRLLKIVGLVCRI